ncbi:MAG: hypothetical protein LUH15_09750 [Tannerellaceae bacterium]|nr:hypothetical protein [Tannerellaceae bacterium]
MYKAKNGSHKAKVSIRVLSLNNPKHFHSKRLGIIKEVLITLDDLKRDFQRCNNEDIQDYFVRLKRLMSLGDRKRPYSALYSTTILQSESYQWISDFLAEQNIIDGKFLALKQELEFCALLPQ